MAAAAPPADDFLSRPVLDLFASVPARAPHPSSFRCSSSSPPPPSSRSSALALRAVAAPRHEPAAIFPPLNPPTHARYPHSRPSRPPRVRALTAAPGSLHPDVFSRAAPRSLTIATHHPVAEPHSMSLDDMMPDSPPDLSSSKSSTKSSSIQSAADLNLSGDEFADVAHFEDISLAEDVAIVGTPLHTVPPPRVTSKPRPLLTTAQPAPPPMRSPRYNKSSPNLRSGLRSNSSYNYNIRHQGPRSPSSPHSSAGVASPTLNIPSPQSGRSLSPSFRRARPQQARASNSTPSLGVYGYPKPRSSSIQKKRRTAKEIEDEYALADGDDDIPDNLMIANIPLSPRPSHGLSSENTSPERPLSISSNESQPPSFNEQHRAKSWDTAMLGLATDVQELTSRLDDHHLDEQKRHSEPQPPRINNSRSVPLPPIQRGSATMDPLPASKEKEKYLSRTRPGWLPPKSKSEEQKHLKQYKQIMSEFFAMEKRKSQEQEAKIKTREEVEASARRAWEMHVLPQWDETMSSGKARPLWWQGIPANLRGRIWAKAIGNDLHLSAGSYEAALARSKALQQRLDNSTNSSVQQHEPSEAELSANSRSKRSIAAQAEDIADAFPEHQLFQQDQPFHARLHDVLAAYAAYRSDTGHVLGTASIAALLLVHIPDPGRAFVALANLLNRPTSLAFCLNDPNAKDRTFRHVLRGMKLKTPQLHEHLVEKLGDKLQPDQYLGLLCRSLLTSHLEMAEAARVFDILVFEGDGVVVRSAVAYLAKTEAHLYGDETEIVRFLGRSKTGRGGVRAPAAANEIIDWVRWAGKDDGDRPS